jgi:hypothetical protein
MVEMIWLINNKHASITQEDLVHACKHVQHTKVVSDWLPEKQTVVSFL